MIVNSSPATAYAAETLKPISTALKNNAPSAADAPANNAASTKVLISGRSLVLSRLFHTNDPSLEPPVLYQFTMSGNSYEFLNTQDRDIVAKLYEYAQESGIDLEQITNFAFDLAHHRFKMLFGGYQPPGGLFYLDGTPNIAEFDERDEALAQQILASNAYKDTEIDHGFLDAILTPTKQSLHSVDFAVLQQLVYAFSASGSDGSADPNAVPVIRVKASDFAPLPPDELPANQPKTSRERFDRLLDSWQKTKPGINQLLTQLNDQDKTVLSALYDRLEKDKESSAKIEEKVLKLALQLSVSHLQQQLLESTQKPSNVPAENPLNATSKLDGSEKLNTPSTSNTLNTLNQSNTNPLTESAPEFYKRIRTTA